MRFKPLKHYQQGQGMVEYAIMLILLITLVIGGIELSGATLASGKASDAAKAGANDFGEVNAKRLNAQENQAKYLRQLDILFNGGAVQVDENGLLTSTTGNGAEANAESAVYENYVDFLDRVARESLIAGDTQTDAFVEFLNEDGDYYNGLVGSTPYSDLADIIQLIDGVLPEEAADGEISLEELIYAVRNKDTLRVDVDDDGDEDSFNITREVVNLSPDTAAEKTARYKALILFEEIELSLLPLDPRGLLSQSIPLLGDHDPDNAAFVRPNCSIEAGDVIYDDGLPDADDDGVPDRDMAFTLLDDEGVEQDVEGDFPAVYLFNPLPIQLDSCVGNDANRDNRAQISILVGGFGKPIEQGYVRGLPKLNESFYGQYSHVCLDAGNAYARCGTANAAEEILKPPGKLCQSNTASDTIDSCTDDTPPLDTSGFYFWGQVNDAGQGQFSWQNNETIEFRPTFQLICNGGDSAGEDDFSLISNTECFDVPDDEDALANLKNIRVNVRYRHVFESFLTFGMLELDQANLAQYFYDPSNLRSPTVSVGSGIAGSELGPKKAGGNPTVKQFKDFRGCYEINVETNQISSCN